MKKVYVDLRSSALVIVAPNSENSKGTQAEAKRLVIPLCYYAMGGISNNNKQTGLDSLDFDIIKVFNPSGILKELTKHELISTINNGCINHWQAAKIYCNKLGGTLPTMEQLANLASIIYGKENIEPYKDYSKLTIKREYEDLLQLGYYYWSSEEYNASLAYSRSFNSSSSHYYYNDKNFNAMAICIRSKDNR